MAVPKRRKSKATRDHRRAQWMRSVAVPSVSVCPNCQEPKLPHRICAACGYYRDREVIVSKAESTEA
jgi:large subunit ribosomal protein L32